MLYLIELERQRSMKKKGYYVHFDARQSIGVSKKIDMQIAELGRQFCMQEIPITAVSRSLIKRILGLFPLASIARNYENALSQIEDPDFIYLRRTVADHAYIDFLRRIKEEYPRCKVIIEIFTYPYNKDDFGKWNAWPFFLKEMIYRRQLEKYVDRFVTYSQDEEIFGIPTIRTTNGVDLHQIRLVTGTYSSDRIVLVGVAYMQRQHGYERLITGLKEYYDRAVSERKVYLYLVGDGPEKDYYQKLVSRYQLQNYVILYPTMIGEELDEIYDQADIALASFGFYKAGVYHTNSSLKVCECLAKGLPFATGCTIAGIEDTCPFMFLFPNDKTVISIEQLINKFDKLRKGKEKQELAMEIRNFAAEKVSMEKVMKPIIEYIKE